MNWPYQLILVAMIILVIVGILVKSTQSESSIVLIIAFGVILSSLHWLRPDHKFIRLYFVHYCWICLSEYLILSLPLIIGILFSSNAYLVTGYLGFLVMLVTFIQPTNRIAKNALSLKFIPDQYYEWKSGLRKYFYLMVALWVIGLVFSFQMGVVILAIFLIGLISISFFDYNEPTSILTAPRRSAKAFLHNRVKGLLIISVFIYAPLFFAFCIFHIVSWYVPLIIILILVSYQFYALVIKYAFYEPQTRPSKNTVLLSLGAFVFVLPFILPALWVLSIKLYFQSIQKLNFYLHDFN